MFAGSRFAGAQKLTPAVAAVDHLLLGAPDLDRGIERVQRLIGVRPEIGGAHPGAGTRNALVSLGNGHYLEIIAPDPSQSEFNFQIDFRGLAEPRLITFAVTTTDIERMASLASAAGYKLFGPRPGSRVLTSGKTLRWKSLRILNHLGSGSVDPVPFFIQWDPDVAHPSKTSPPGCELQSLEFQHPSPAELSAVLKTFGLEARISQAGAARILANIKTPKGAVELS